MDRFWLKEGRSFYGQLRKKVCQEAGREIDLDVKLDLIRYMEFYLAYGKEMAAYIDCCPGSALSGKGRTRKPG